MSYYDIRNHATQKRNSSNGDMSLKQAFERDVNKQMEGDDHDKSEGDGEESDIKKRPVSPSSTLVEDDLELAQKKDPPPRFSRIHDYGPAPIPAPVIIERDPPQREKRRGIFIPMPIFILLAILFFFMGTLLFVYTIIGLYNNRPAALLNFGGPQPAPIDGCNCADKGIHIAPNFVMGDQAKTVTTTVTLTPSAVAADAKTSSSSSSSTTKKSKSTTTPTPSTKVVEVTPPPKLITSTSLLAVGPDGKPLPTTTLHSTRTIAPTISTAKPDANKEASIKSVLKSAKTALDITVSGSDLNPLTSDLPKPTSSKTTKDKDKNSTKTKEKDEEPTPCDPSSLTNSCQH